MKSLSVRDLKSINQLEKLWNEKRDTAGKINDEDLVDVYSKIRSYPNAGSRIHQLYFLEVLGIGLEKRSSDYLIMDLTQLRSCSN